MLLDQKRLQQLLYKYGRNECSQGEMSELEKWYASLGTNRQQVFSSSDEERAVQEMLWQQLTSARMPARRFQLPAWAKIAAVLIPLLTAGILWALHYKKTSSPLQEDGITAKTFTIPYGATKKITLPDGSEVWLNAGSTLTTAEGFNNGNREVTLNGEAYFDVEQNAGIPFVIRTGKMNIRVLGTTFNVKAYPEDVTTEASLIQGAIEVTLTGKPGKRFVLKPSEKIVLPNREKLHAIPGAMPENAYRQLQKDGYTISNVTVSPEGKMVAETAWTSNRLTFINESFAEIAQQLERKFQVEIHFSDDAIRNLRFTATFLNEDVRGTLDALQYTATDPFTFRIDKNQIYITRKN